jgi:hypothetical protein
MTDDFTPNYAKTNHCKNCNFICSKKSDWDRHILTRKHRDKLQILTNVVENAKNYAINEVITHKYGCECGNRYKHKQSLYNHKKKCEVLVKKSTELHTNEISINELVTKLINQNSELQQILIDQNNKIFELAKEAKNVTNNTNNTTNNNNTTFNLQFYLNDTCKDAISLVDFVDSLQVKLQDLEETARLGYTEGVSRIIINGLNELDVCKRPIHCSDLKRETLYIKDQDEWTKEDSDKTHLSKAIKDVSKKNVQQIFEWQKKYPEYKNPDSRQSDRYMEMICNTMNASSKEEQDKNMNKIIKNITKEVVIDKNI